MVAEPIAMLDRTADTSYDAHREASRTRPANPPPYDPMIPNHNAHNSGDLGTQRSQIHSRSSSPDSRNSRNHSRNRVSFVEPAHPTQSGGKKKTSYLPGFAGGSSKHGNTTTVTSDMIEKEDDGSNGPNREIYISRMFFRCVSLVLSFVLIGLLAHVLSVHAGSKDRTAINKGTGLEFRLWPKDLNLKPTHILLTAGSLCAFLSIGILIASFNAKVRSFPLLISPLDVA